MSSALLATPFKPSSTSCYSSGPKLTPNGIRNQQYLPIGVCMVVKTDHSESFVHVHTGNNLIVTQLQSSWNKVLWDLNGLIYGLTGVDAHPQATIWFFSGDTIRDPQRGLRNFLPDTLFFHVSYFLCYFGLFSYRAPIGVSLNRSHMKLVHGDVQRLAQSSLFSMTICENFQEDGFGLLSPRSRNAMNTKLADTTDDRFRSFENTR